MGKLDSVITFTGTVGNLSFYKTQDGHIVRRKWGPSAERINTDPAYAPTRKNNAEFARAGKATHLIRLAFADLLPSLSDNRVSGRLTRQFVKIIKSDMRNLRGERKVMDGDTTILKGFEFNVHTSLTKSMKAQFTASIDSRERKASISVPAFDPSTFVGAPEAATHFQLRSAAALIDFTHDTQHATTCDSDIFSLDCKRLPAFRLDHSLEAKGSGSVFLVLGIEFLQNVNRRLAGLESSAHNAMAIVSVARSRESARETFGRDSDIVDPGQVSSLHDLICHEYRNEDGC